MGPRALLGPNQLLHSEEDQLGALRPEAQVEALHSSRAPKRLGANAHSAIQLFRGPRRSPGPTALRHQTPEGRQGRARLAAQATSQAAPRPRPSSRAELRSPAGAAKPRSKPPLSEENPSRGQTTPPGDQHVRDIQAVEDTILPPMDEDTFQQHLETFANPPLELARKETLVDLQMNLHTLDKDHQPMRSQLKTLRIPKLPLNSEW
ncbi:hypothetical protein NDU88_005127 [Pleurodeles waltl]|uniref:Uncharacterized protein n=1 Tax=Pleurodeles waltl TaxID=8319 RepID=A0AAV7WTV2_PLEWA|nr:hypothetical protein NDU88_005127 [Pleurodeles waltl]